MSSYLIAFAISDYAMLEGKSNSSDVYSQTLVRVFGQANRINDTMLVLDSGIKTLSAIGRYVGIPFTLEKIDQIGVPTFGGAMENWGLVVYGLEYISRGIMRGLELIILFDLTVIKYFTGTIRAALLQKREPCE